MSLAVRSEFQYAVARSLPNTKRPTPMRPKVLVLDVHYEAEKATAAGVLFCGWSVSHSTHEEIVQLDHVAEYQPGEFFRRELPCLMAVIQRFENAPELIVIDGYVWLDYRDRKSVV